MKYFKGHTDLRNNSYVHFFYNVFVFELPLTKHSVNTSELQQHSLIITAMDRKGVTMLKCVLFVTCVLFISSFNFLKNNVTAGFTVNAVPKPNNVSVTHGRKEIPGIRKGNYSTGKLDWQYPGNVPPPTLSLIWFVLNL